MCGRFTLRFSQADVAKQLAAMPRVELYPRYNIAPTQDVAVVRPAESQRELVFMRWGLIPSWATDAKIGNRMINARSETVATTPAFRSAYKKRRCLIPADGFYEWKRDGKVKQPYHIHMNDGSLFAFAGLWETWQGADSCTILTTDANDLVRDVHDRMPVILAPDDYGEWLAGDTIPLAPYPADRMAMTPVSHHVNSPAYDGPECLEG